FFEAALRTVFLAPRFAAGFAARLTVFFLLLLEFRRLAMESLPAARAVNGAGLGERVAEVPAARALGFERFVAAADAVSVVGVVGTEPAAHGAALGDLVGHAES
ncbi:MAG TPA: hypothetical protein VHB25_11570, partial [Gemmatimonadaceae bacterium]|nr:hypothetical protein [Gemmatimonadaceae bacterium]